MGFTTTQVGSRCEGFVLAALVSTGYSVLLPFGTMRYDLVYEDSLGFHRVQCKSGHLERGVVVFNLCSSPGGSKARKYSARDIDFYGVHCWENGLSYLVPVGEMPAGTKGGLRIAPTRNSQARNVRWAKDYLLDVAQQDRARASEA